MLRLRRRLHAVQSGLPVDERSRRFLQQSCRPLKVTTLSHADDAGQLLEFVFAAIHPSQAKSACVKLGLYFAVAEEFVEVSQVFLVFLVKDL